MNVHVLQHVWQASAVESKLRVPCVSDLFNLTVAECARAGNLRYFALLTVFFVFVGKFKLIHEPLSLFRFRLLLSKRTERPGCGSRPGRPLIGEHGSHPSQKTRGELHFCDRVSACLRCILTLIS